MAVVLNYLSSGYSSSFANFQTYSFYLSHLLSQIITDMSSSHLGNPLMLQYHKRQLSGDAPSNKAASESVKSH